MISCESAGNLPECHGADLLVLRNQPDHTGRVLQLEIAHPPGLRLDLPQPHPDNARKSAGPGSTGASRPAAGSWRGRQPSVPPSAVSQKFLHLFPRLRPRCCVARRRCSAATASFSRLARCGLIESRVRVLAETFAVGVYAFARMSSHFRLALAVRPDTVRSWSDDEVVERWQRARGADAGSGAGRCPLWSRRCSRR